jgi:hypothetical protein
VPKLFLRTGDIFDDSTGTAMTTRILVVLQPSLEEVSMTCGSRYSFASIRTLVLAALLAVGWMASTTLPVFAGTSGTWANTGSLNTGRTDHTATLLPNGQVLVVGGQFGIYLNVLASAELYTP